MLKLSVIIPIYNVEPYLRKCVDSILAQDLAKDTYEIILVDDGSPDGCPAICDEYASRYINVRVIHQPNGGLSAARNAGILAAQGEYIQFVDSDDYLQFDSLGALLKQIECEDLDVLRFDYQNVKVLSEETSSPTQQNYIRPLMQVYQIYEPNKTPRPIDKRTEVVSGEQYLNERMPFACYATQFIVRRSLIVNPQSPSSNLSCLFVVGIHYEDVDWMPRMMLRAKRVNSTTRVVYNYLHREGSITATKDPLKLKKNVEDRIIVIQNLIRLYEQYPTCTWLQQMCGYLVVAVLNIISIEYHSEVNVYIHRLQDLQVFPLSVGRQGKTYTRRVRLINIHPMLYCFLNKMISKIRTK